MNRRDIVFKYFREQEDEINEIVAQGIEKNRKGYLSVNVTDKCGKPIPNAKVRVSLQKHEFMHGANIFMLDELARKYFPNNRLIINEGPYDAFTNFKYDRHPYYMQIERALLKGATIDSIGAQFHMFPNPTNEAECIEQFGNPKKILAALDQYARLGLPIQITETTFPALSWGSEDEDIQAELLRRYYSLWFSHEAVEGIIYWNLVDGYAAWAPQGDMTRGENVFYGGLLRFDMSEKPAYQVVKELFYKEWNTEETFVTNESGCA